MRTMRIACLVAILFLLNSAAFGHTTWVQVGGEYNLAGPGRVFAFVNWGHHLPIDDPIDGKHIEAFVHFTPSGKSAELSIHDHKCIHPNMVACSEPGAHTLAVDLKPGYYTMYIGKKDGKMHHHLGSMDEVKDDARVIILALRYYQYAKAVVNVGPGVKGATRPVGRRFEIVPEAEIAPLKPGDEFRFHLLFDGKPLADKAAMCVSYLGYSTAQDDFWIKKRALKNGRGRFDIVRPGVWFVRVNFYREPAEAEKAKCRHVHYTTTLVFEVSKPKAKSAGGHGHGH